MGATTGRTAIAGSQSYATGAVAVCTLVAVQRLVSVSGLTRCSESSSITGCACSSIKAACARASCGLTANDLFTQLRQCGVFSLAGVHYVLHEMKGSITIVMNDAAGTRA